MLKRIKIRIKKKIESYLYSKIGNVLNKKILQKDFINIFSQLQQFYNAPDEMLSSKVEARTVVTDIVERFEKNGAIIKREKIDADDFNRWISDNPEMSGHYNNQGDVKIEKLLEHYLTTHYLQITGRSITYIDIAAASSPFASVVAKHTGCNALGQDLIFKDGVHGNKIGSDAGEMPVIDNFADVLTLHCAYECFQGDSDIRFIKEASRVLKTNGRLGIVPLYIDDVYFVKTGPRCDKRKIKIEPDARWIWRDDQYDSEPFSRHYSPESFITRVIDNSPRLKCELLYFINLDELRSKHIGQRIYCNFMFRAVK